MRRRSKIELVVHDDDIRNSPGLVRRRRDPVRRRRRTATRRVLRRAGSRPSGGARPDPVAPRPPTSRSRHVRSAAPLVRRRHPSSSTTPGGRCSSASSCTGRLLDDRRTRTDGDARRPVLPRTRWEAANGFELTDGIKVLIAAQASMLLLGLEIDDYPQLTSVIVHPSTVRLHGEYSAGGAVRASGTQSLLGQAHYRGPVVLSWNAARQGARFPGTGQNVVYHEFAHQLDMLDGITDGTPPLGRRSGPSPLGRGVHDRVRHRSCTRDRPCCGPTRAPTRPSSSPSPPRCSSTARSRCELRTGPVRRTPIVLPPGPCRPPGPTLRKTPRSGR